MNLVIAAKAATNIKKAEADWRHLEATLEAS
jgi:hypothetical protein